MAEVKHDERSVRVVDLTGRRPDREGRLVADVTFGPQVRTKLSLQTGAETMTAEASDLFTALQELRRKIHPWCPAVQGARLGVWASGMSREGGALRVQDINAEGSPTVDLLDAAPRDQLSTVDEQKAVFDKYWSEVTKGARWRTVAGGEERNRGDGERHRDGRGHDRGHSA